MSHSNVMLKKICVNDFSGTTSPRILKLGTNIGYDLLYRVRKKSASSCLLFPLFFHFPFSSIKYFVADFSFPIRARFFELCVHLQRVEVFCVKEIDGAEMFWPSFLPFSFLQLSLQCNAKGNLCQRLLRNYCT